MKRPPKPKKVDLPTVPGTPEQVHLFDAKEELAIKTAIAAQRPLLVRGEPGTGKTQLAKAAAIAQRREFYWYTVHSRTEARDLLYHFDAVARLGRAQTLGALGGTIDAEARITKELAVGNFIVPQALWWGFDKVSAAGQTEDAGVAPPPPSPWAQGGAGAVVLIDEIDKADTDVPNGLLEALGAGQFPVIGRSTPIHITEPAPLVVITTNDERALPDAFLRRCVLLHLRLPEDRDELISHLVARAKLHFPGMDESIIKEAASQLADDRATAKLNGWRPLPGQAELLDLLRAARQLGSGPEEWRALLGSLREFVMHKHLTAP